MDSLYRGEAEDLIKRHSGRVTGNVSGRTTFLLVGQQCGQSKTRQVCPFPVCARACLRARMCVEGRDGVRIHGCLHDDILMARIIAVDVSDDDELDNHGQECQQE